MEAATKTQTPACTVLGSATTTTCFPHHIAAVFPAFRITIVYVKFSKRSGLRGTSPPAGESVGSASLNSLST